MDPENAAIAAEQNTANKRAVAKAARERRKQNPDREVRVDDRLRRKARASLVSWANALSCWRFDFVGEDVYLPEGKAFARAGDEIATLTAYWPTSADRRFVQFALLADGSEVLRGGVDRVFGRKPREYERAERIDAPTGDGQLHAFVGKVAALSAQGPDGIGPPRCVVHAADTREELLDMRGTLATSGRPCGNHGESALAAARRVGIHVHKVTADGAWAIGVLDGDRVGVHVDYTGIPWRACFGRVGE